MTVKTALEKKDTELAAAQKEASQKAKEANEKLKSVGKLEEEKKTLEVAVKKSREELAEWRTKLEHIIAKKAELEQFVEEFGDTVSEKLKGKLS